MELNGKAKEDFLEYYNNHSIKYLLSWTDFDDLPLVVQNSLIIEWFDSMEYKGKRMYSDFFYFYWKYKIPSQSFNDICIQTIEMCNKFYNTLESHQLPD